jgi:hypothetical protein
MNIVGKFTIKLYDKSNQLVDIKESYNVITALGRERMMDIWSTNFNKGLEYSQRIFGIREVDCSPAVTPSGNRRCTFWDQNQNNSYDSYIGGGPGGPNGDSDIIFTKGNTHHVPWTLGVGESSYNRWHQLSLNRYDVTNEEVTVPYLDNPVQLVGSYLMNDTTSTWFTVKNFAETITYTYNTDYTFDQQTGTITILSSGSINISDVIKVSYVWHQTDMFPHGMCGMRLDGYVSHGYSGLYKQSWLGRMGISHDGGDTWGEGAGVNGETFPEYGGCFPWEGRPGANRYVNWRSDSDGWWTFSQANIRKDGSQNQHWAITLPYVFNNPTTILFDASFNYGELNMKRWRFYEPRVLPQTPQVLAIGTGSTAESVNDTSLEAEVERYDVTSVIRDGVGVGKWSAFLDFNDAVGHTIREIGLLFGDEWRATTEPGWTWMHPPKKENCNKLFSRTVLQNPWTKTADQSAEIIYEISLV